MGRTPSRRGHRALRRGRVSVPGTYYLVTTATFDRQPLFHDFYLGRLVVAAMRRASPQADTKCFVVMPDHVHWLFRLREGADLSRTVARTKAGAARRIRERAPRIRAVWQRGFHDHAIRDEDTLRSMARYVVTNPLRAGLVERIEEYPVWDAVWVDDGRVGD